MFIVVGNVDNVDNVDDDVDDVVDDVKQKDSSVYCLPMLVKKRD